MDCSPPGSPIPGILQARTLEWVAISFSNAWKWKVKVKSLSHVRLFETPKTATYQSPPSMGVSRQEYWSGVPLPSPWVESRHGDLKVMESTLHHQIATTYWALTYCVSSTMWNKNSHHRMKSQSRQDYLHLTDKKTDSEMLRNVSKVSQKGRGGSGLGISWACLFTYHSAVKLRWKKTRFSNKRWEDISPRDIYIDLPWRLCPRQFPLY